MLVLSFLVLISVLVVAFFSSVSTEISAAKAYSDGADAKQLADSTVQMAMSTIRQATAGGTNLAWASQPGMIRTYDANGNASTCYKLYSSDHAVVSTSELPYNPAADYDSEWRTKTALFTDLNAPTSGTNFPILDGNNIRLLTQSGSGVTVPPYLGYDADRDGRPDVQGFAIDPNVITNFDENKPPSVTNTAVPIPVKWLYVLQDGSLTLPTGADASGKVAQFASAAKVPTVKNPIIGRIAFWTDDESSKVNINTASEGGFWDTPRADGMTERNLGAYQPATREYQRYPGHPATTSLSTVFPKLTAAQLYEIAPRVSGTGASQPPPAMPASTAAPGGVTNDSDRLYSEIDELLFTPENKSAGRTPNPLTRQDVERAKFFLTAHSRAPEVNLFSRPRVTIWPVDASLATDAKTQRATATDRLIAFCSMMRNDRPADQRYRYYFQRSNPNSATVDFNLQRNLEIYKYLQYLTKTSIPGFGGDFLTKYGNDRDQILTEIFDYIRVVNLVDPQLGGGFSLSANTYAPGRQLQNENPIAGPSAPNPWGYGLVAPSSAEVTTGNPTRGFGRFDTISGAALWCAGIAQTGTTIKNQDGSEVPLGTLVPPVCPPVGYTRVQALFVFDFFNPAYNWPFAMCGFEYRVTGLDGFGWRRDPSEPYTPMGFAANPPASSYWKANQLSGGRQGFTTALSQKQSPSTPPPIPAPAVTGDKFYYPFCSGTTVLKTSVGGVNTNICSADFPTGGVMDFSGGTISYDLKFNNVVIQSGSVTFPPGRFPVPSLASSAYAVPGRITRNFRYFFTPKATGANPPLGGRFSTDDTNQYVDPGDTIEEMISSSGDLRLIAAQSHVPASQFKPHADYGDGKTHFAHSLWMEGYTPYTGATYGTLVNGVLYGNDPAGDATNWPNGHAVNSNMSCWWSNNDSKTGVAAGKTAPFKTGDVPGDWDNGMADEQDGPYINKVDEGNLFGQTPATAGANRYPYYATDYNGSEDSAGTYFSPDRQIPSAGMFGSLPTGVRRNLPWQTLLFRPDPAGHPGRGIPAGGPAGGPAPYTIPPDHLIMDLFTMPVVEPYAISEPFSTAGKVNMNYQIVPFAYITRETAVRAALKPEKIMAIPNSDGAKYKSKWSTASVPSYRFSINPEETLKGFQQRFGSKDIFRSATEICDLYLVPQDGSAKYSGMSAFWDTRRLTGDNTRERPYANLYPRLTTKSNTFTVHYRVQSLKKVVNSPVAVWDESKDRVTAEVRGSSLVERYIDPNDPSLPDFVTDTAKTVDSYYRLRVISSKRFGL